MERREFLAGSAAAVAALSATLADGPEARAQTAAGGGRPRVVLID